MDFRQLQYVLKVAEEKSFSKAAQKLYIAQPSLSQFIIKLEQQLGVQLFDRTTNPLRLTYAGELYVKTASQILDLKDQLLQQMDDISNFKKGRIAIGLSSFRSTYIMPSILPKFHEKFPGIEVILMEGISSELEEFALKGITDITLGPLPIKEDLFAYEPIAKEEILLAIPPNHALSLKFRGEDISQHPQINLSLLRDEPFILLKHDQKLHQIAVQLCRQSGFQPNIVLESNSIEASNALAAAGMGIAFIPDALIRFGQVVQRPVYFSIEGLSPYRQLIVSYRKERYLSKAAREFISVMKEILCE